MTAASLQFGPEWMRTKQQTAPSATRPPTSLLSPSQTTVTPAPPGPSSYSSLLTSPAPAPPEKQDLANPFVYSKEEMIQIWKEGGGRGGLGLEVELWEGIVKEIGGEPIGLRGTSELEKKLFSLPLNSDVRRRQSHDFLPTLSPAIGDRPKVQHAGPSAHTPLTQQRGFGALGNRRRKDEDSLPHPGPRRLSTSSVSSPLAGPLSPISGGLSSSPRPRLGSGTHGPDAVGNMNDGSWRKRDTDVGRPSNTGGNHEQDGETGTRVLSHWSNTNLNGSVKDPDIARPPSDESNAPSLPSIPRGSSQELFEDLTIKLRTASPHEQGTTRDVPDTPSLVDAHSMPATESGISATRPPGVEQDPANVSWSYRDLKGNIQGPFAATLMQKWYDEGYFTPGLLMKRTHVDPDWIPVGELSRRAGNEKLFFSSFTDYGPPGLSRPADAETYERFGQSLIQPQYPASDPSVNGSPLRPFRNSSSTRIASVESFLTSPSNTSDSSAPAFGATVGPMPSASPDLAFGAGGGRSAFGNNTLEPTFTGRAGTFDAQSALGARGVSGTFNANTDPPYDPLIASLGHRGAIFDTQGLPHIVSTGSSSPWTTGANGNVPRNSETGLGELSSVHRASVNHGVFTNSSMTNISGFNDVGSNDPTTFGSEMYNYTTVGLSQLGRGIPSADVVPSNFGPIGPGGGLLRDQGLRQHQELDEITRGSGNFDNGYTPATSVVHGYGSSFGIAGTQVGQLHTQHAVQHIPPMSSFGQSPAATSTLTTISPQQPSIQNLPVSQSPWGVPEPSAQPRPRPFDAPHPTSRNVVRTPITINDSSRQHASDWHNASKPDLNDGWGDISTTQTPAITQGGETTQGRQSGWSIPLQSNTTTPDLVTEQGQVPLPKPQPLEPQTHEPTTQAVPKKRGTGPPVQTSQTPGTKPPPAAPVQVPKSPLPLPPVSLQAKPAWSTPNGTEDETKPMKQAGLREIQEAEAKRMEARKIAEREKEHATRAQPQEETQTYTASWGLPTSQVGAARSLPKEQSPVMPPVVTPPVWTNAGKPPQTKRTMKEIQQEEERQKKTAARDKETAAAAARRAYADSANKPPGPSAGGAWTTVGSGGKPNPNAPANRHPSSSGQPALPSAAAVRSLNGTAQRPSSVSAQSTKSSMPKPADDSPVPPSPEFMKWLREAVRGFNQGFNTEEFMAMLLTFSLDFPTSTVEMIQDMVYMNSATLDGRRFAADFCSKRKADAANRPKVSVGGKPPSLAEVVKTQPKPAQSEFGFKIVKKKGRGNALR